MSVCASCGLVITSELALCHHHHASSDDWAEGNRLMCDFVHRGKIPPRLAPQQREEDFWNASS